MRTHICHFVPLLREGLVTKDTLERRRGQGAASCAPQPPPPCPEEAGSSGKGQRAYAKLGQRGDSPSSHPSWSMAGEAAGRPILGPVFHRLRGSWEALQGQAGQNSPEVRSGGDRAGQNSRSYEFAAVGWTTTEPGGQIVHECPLLDSWSCWVPRHNQDEVGAQSWAPPQEMTSKP